MSHQSEPGYLTWVVAVGRTDKSFPKFAKVIGANIPTNSGDLPVHQPYLTFTSREEAQRYLDDMDKSYSQSFRVFEVIVHFRKECK